MIALGIVAALLASSAGAKVAPQNTRYYKNWAAGCDNGLTCEAVALSPPESSLEHPLSLVLKRDIGADNGLVIRIMGLDSDSDRYQLFADNHLVDTGPINRDTKSITILDKDAMKLARALVRGKNARLMDGSGKILGQISLDGSAKALRYIDARQGYAGSRGAIVARGSRVARTKSLTLPVISAKRIGGNEALPEAAELVALAEGSQCARARFDVIEDSVHSLGSSGKAQALALINCGGGAYNQTDAVYIGTQNTAGKWHFEPARLDYAHQTDDDTKTDLILLQNAVWDARTQQLTSASKGRGIGDCGFSANYVWDGSSFRLTQAREMKLCQGAVDWITVWRAKVQFEG